MELSPYTITRNRRIAWVRRAALQKGTPDLCGVWFDGFGCIASDQRRLHLWDHESLEHTRMPELDPPNAKVAAMPKLRAVVPPMNEAPLLVRPRAFLITLRRLATQRPNDARLTHIYIRYSLLSRGFFLQVPKRQPSDTHEYQAFVACTGTAPTQRVPALFDLQLLTQMFDNNERIARWSQPEQNAHKKPLRLDYFDGRTAVVLPCLNLDNLGAAL